MISIPWPQANGADAVALASLVFSGDCELRDELPLTQSIRDRLRCPICSARLTWADEQVLCSNADCKGVFPLVNGIPLIINESNSVFSINDIMQGDAAFYGLKTSWRQELIDRCVPKTVASPTSKTNYEALLKLLLERFDKPRVLVIGGGIAGHGMRSLIEHPSVELVDTDVALGPRTKLVCDAHDIPFEDNTFDGVIAQAVLMHVVDPYRCVSEIHRVLSERGIVYAETSFTQPVCGAGFDITRFTPLGHRRLFREFEEIDSGIACGPGSALASSFRWFLLSFAENKKARRALKLISAYTTFYLKYFDRYLIRKSGALDAAMGVYFLGTKSNAVLDDRELIRLYRGAF